jgi:heptosyltransferase-3
MHLRVIETLGLQPLAEIVFTPRTEDINAARAALIRQGITTDYAVLHPFPKFRYKRWHDQGWIEVAEWLRQRGLQVVITGGNDADERTYCASLAARASAKSLAGTLALPATAAVIAGATAYLGPDTVTTHMAAALGVPTVALFGPGDPLKWGPWPHAHAGLDNPWRHTGSNQISGNVQIVQGNTLCAPCFLEGCDRHVHSVSDCLAGLPARRVIGALERQLTMTRSLERTA